MGNYIRDNNGRSGGGREFGSRGYGGGNRGFGNRSFGGGGGFRGGRDSERAMFKTICSECGKECEVPFKPTNSKPVYCNECFRNNRDDSPRRSEERSDRGDKNFENPRQSDFDNKKMIKEQFELLNKKLDQLLKALGGTAQVSPKKEEVKPVKKVAKKAVKKPVAKKA